MAITIERRLPERGQRMIAAAPAGQCCCCCCCCLHSVGGAIGALSASARPIDPTQLPVSAIAGPTLEPRYSATGLYWAFVAILSSVIGTYFLVFEGEHIETVTVALVIAIFFPAVQLAASLVTAIAIWRSRRVGKDVRLRHLGKITLRALIGALIGTALMLPLLSRC